MDGEDSQPVPPLPRRIWWPWDRPASRVGFERTFQVEAPARATLHVATSGPYQAWLDGRPLPIPEGPLPAWRAMHAIPAELAAGPHRLCMEAEPGEHGQPSLLACLDWSEQGRPARTASDATWRMAADPPPDWAARPPDAAWRPAWAFDGVWAEPWGMPANAPEDFCRLSHGWQKVSGERLQRVVRLHQGLAAAGAAAWARARGVLEMRPVSPFPQAPPHLANRRPAREWYTSRRQHNRQVNRWLELFEARAPHAVLDSGAETFARVVVRLRSGGPAILAISSGESLPEVDRYTGRASDVFTLHDGEAFATTPTGLRYVKIMALSAAASTVVLEPLEVQHIRYQAEPLGRFSCSHADLEAIWNLSARTVHLCMQNEIWDGIKRDQLPWLGDLCTEALASYHLFGTTSLARRWLEVLGEIGPAPARPLEQQRYPGLVATWKQPGGDINTIPSYTLWWVVGLADHFRDTGDLPMIVGLVEELEATLEHVVSWVGEDGLWRHRAGWDYVDWSPIPAAERVEIL